MPSTGDTAAASAVGAATGGPIGAAIPWIFKGASLLGGLFGKKKKKIDMNWLEKHMGPAALAKRTQDIANNLLNSQYGQKLITSASEQGSLFANEMNARAAQAGLSPDTGGQSAASDFTTAAGEGAGASFKRDVESNMYQQAAPMAQEQLNREYEAYLKNLDQENGQQSTWEKVASVASPLAASFFDGRNADTTPGPKTADSTVPQALASRSMAAPTGASQFQMQQPLAPQNNYVARMLAMQNPTLRMTRSKRRGGLR
jgi:hypothetical protein